MIDKSFATELGTIKYWVSETAGKDSPQLVFLPGLTADHRLFDKQVEYFEGKYRMLVWDHAGSCIRYNKTWEKKTGIPIHWIEGAGHNSNTDKPDEINSLIESFLEENYAI